MPNRNTQFGNSLRWDYTELQSSLSDSSNTDWAEKLLDFIEIFIRAGPHHEQSF